MLFQKYILSLLLVAVASATLDDTAVVEIAESNSDAVIINNYRTEERMDRIVREIPSSSIDIKLTSLSTTVPVIDGSLWTSLQRQVCIKD